MSLFSFEILWCQRDGGGIGDFFGGLVILLLIALRVIHAVWGNRTNAVVAEGQTPLTAEEEQELIEQLEEEWEALHRANAVQESVEVEADYRPAQSVFDRQSAPQEEGSRFDVKPGILGSSHLVVPPMEPSVKPTLESLTGVYEDAFTQTERTQEGAGADILSQLRHTTNIRQAFILAEIFRRPEL